MNVQVHAACGLTAALIVTAVAPSINWAAVRARARDPQRASTATPTPPARLDVLRNGNFEGPFTRQWNAANDAWANGRIAEGWTAWWRKPTAPDGQYPGRCPEDETACQPWHEPEYRETKGIPYDPPRVRSGDNSQMYFTSFGLHEGGLYQNVRGVPLGWRFRFSIWVRAWSSDTEDTSQSRGQPSMHLQVGIDPTGGIDPWSSAVVWSGEFDSFDTFDEYDVEAVAKSDTVTVFFRSRPERALKHVDVMLDDAGLILIGPPPPTPVIIDSPNSAAGAATPNAPTGGASPRVVVHVVQPGDTLFAIAQAYRADLSAIYALNGLDENSALKVGQTIRIPLPVESPPTPAPTLTPLPPAAIGTLCVGAFEDAAGDGYFGEGDRPLRGAEFVVVNASGQTVITSNTAWEASPDAERCFADLPAGAYAVSAQVPAGYLATTETRWGVALTEGARVDLAVGGRRVAESDGGDAPEAPPIALGVGSIIVVTVIAVALRRARRNGIQDA